MWIPLDRKEKCERQHDSPRNFFLSIHPLEAFVNPNSENPNSVRAWKLRSTSLGFDSGPAIMGIVNVTPDSFSDGGNFSDPQIAIDHALKLSASGARILDIGGESTRPYSNPVSADDEIRRVVPVIAGITKQCKTPVSIDTSKAVVAKAALDAGAEIINDVTGLEGDPEMLSVAAESGAGVCAMHMQGSPQTMQDDPQYENVVTEIHAYLSSRKARLLEAGIEQEKICLDPGVGFGKTHEHNIELIQNCHQFLDLGCPILVGHSRKGFIGKLLNDKETNRDAGTLAITLSLAQQGMHVIRVHEVQRTVQALKVWNAISLPSE
jgi:dihydropteroate synthase